MKIQTRAISWIFGDTVSSSFSLQKSSLTWDRREVGVFVRLQGNDHQRRDPAPSWAVFVTEKRGSQRPADWKKSTELICLCGGVTVLPCGPSQTASVPTWVCGWSWWGWGRRSVTRQELGLGLLGHQLPICTGVWEPHRHCEHRGVPSARDTESWRQKPEVFPLTYPPESGGDMQRVCGTNGAIRWARRSPSRCCPLEA